MNGIFKRLKNQPYWVWLVFSLVLAAGLRFCHIGINSIDGDEAFSYFISRYPIGQIAAKTALDVHPPLFYWLLHIWMRYVGPSLTSMRLLSALCGVGVVATSYIIARYFTSSKRAVLVALFVAINPILIAYSQNVRMYSLVVLLLSLSILPILELRKNYLQKTNLSWKIVAIVSLFCLVATAALYTHYMCILFLLIELSYIGILAIRKRNYTLLGCVGTMLVVPAILFAPWLPILWQQTHNVTGGLTWAAKITWVTLPQTVWKYLALVEVRNWLLAGSLWIVFGLICWALIKGFRRSHLLLHLLVWPPLLLIISISIFRPLLHERYVLFSALVLSIVLVLSILNLTSRKLVYAYLVGLFLISCVGLTKLYFWPSMVYTAFQAKITSNFEAGDGVYADKNVYIYLPMLYDMPSTQALTLPTETYAYNETFKTMLPDIYTQQVAMDEVASKRAWVVLADYDTKFIESIPSNWTLHSEWRAENRALLLFDVVPKQ